MLQLVSLLVIRIGNQSPFSGNHILSSYSKLSSIDSSKEVEYSTSITSIQSTSYAAGHKQAKRRNITTLRDLADRF